MAHLNYQETLQNAKAELVSVQNSIGENQRERESLEKQLVTVRQIIASLSAMLGKEWDEENELGLTDAIRQAFQTAGTPLTPLDMKERLESLGYNTAKYGNAMAAVHTVINRLVAQKQIKAAPAVAGKPMYEWISKLPPPPKLSDTA